MGSWMLDDGELRDALIGKRIVAVDDYETFLDITIEGGRRIRLSAGQPHIPEPIIEAWQHADFMGDQASRVPAPANVERVLREGIRRAT